MKKLKLCFATLVVFTMIFTSCSKDEAQIDNSDKASLTFSAIVNDAVNKAANRQSIEDLPDCSADAPAYVRIVLMQGGVEVVGTAADPYRVDLVEGQVFTQEDPALELDPGTYTLDHFSVYNAAGDLIWVAPREGSDLAGFVDVTLPVTFNLGAGVKKYVDVSVLCYDNRDVNEYGYLFFELDATMAYEYCFFANYCDDEGRHYTANYSVNVWLGTDNTGAPLYMNLEPVTGVDDNGDYFASPLCMALPMNDNPDEEYIYYEVTLLDWDENYGTVTPIVLNGTLSRSDIEGNFGPDNTVDYEHLRFNCSPGGEEPTGPACLPALTGDCERVLFIQMVSNGDQPAGTTQAYPIYTEDGDEVGTITYNLYQRPAGKDLLTGTVDLDAGWTATNARFTLPNVDEDDVCFNSINDDNFSLVYEANSLSYPVQARVAINVCPAPQ